ANINQGSEDGNTPLMIAAMTGSKEAAEILIQLGAKQEEQNKKGFTALKWAESQGHEELVRLLKN
ncbi:MAG: ankyrin repeat domain-containing protein, partial [Spirochaetia bacterium]|nr:ankyrin repeat domain-containing protein [Spirochaetia bacterium]